MRRCASVASAVTMAVVRCPGLVALGQAGQQQGIGAAQGAGQGETFSGGEFGQFHADGVVWARRIPWGAKRARAAGERGF
jgi:hypothetical protein